MSEVDPNRKSAWKGIKISFSEQISKSPTPRLQLSRRDWWIVGVVILGPFMAQMDGTIVNVALSSIQVDLRSSVGQAQWIISAYLLAAILMLPLNNFLIDRFGIKKLYTWSFSAFTLASLFCAVSRSMDQLIVARILQGISGGCFGPLTQVMMARIGGKQMARVMGYAAVPILLAPLFAPALAGFILSLKNWPWLFYVNIPIGIASVLLAGILLPRDEITASRRDFDKAGFLFLSPGLAFILYGFDQITKEGGSLFLAVGFVLILLFVWHARKKGEAALIDVGIFKNRTFSWATFILFLVNGMTYMGQLIIPLFLINGCGLKTSEVGFILGANGIGMLCVYPLMGRLVDQFGCRISVASGIILAMLSTLPFLYMTSFHLYLPVVILCLFLRGIGHGATAIPAVTAAFSSVEKEKIGLANIASSVVQRQGGPVMTTLFSVVIASCAAIGATPNPKAFAIPFLALILYQLVVLASSMKLPLRVITKLKT